MKREKGYELEDRMSYRICTTALNENQSVTVK